MMSAKEQRRLRRMIFEADNRKELKKLQRDLVGQFQVTFFIWLLGITVLGVWAFIALWITATILGTMTYHLVLHWRFRKCSP